MKKILLASTILVGTAGFAAADTANFTFSGEASVGFGYDLTNSVGTPTISAEFTAGMMTVTSGGLEAGASITVSAGGRSIDTDHTTTTFGVISDDASSISDAEVYLSGDWGKVTVEYDANVAGVTTDDEIDFTYTNTWGDFTVLAGYYWNMGAANDDAELRGTYSFGDYEVYAGANFNEVGGWSVDSIDFGGSAAMSGFTLAVDANYDLTVSVLTWSATAGYATGAYSVEAFIEDDAGANVNSTFDYGLSGSYDLGGGVSLNAGYVHDGDSAVTNDIITAGVSMSF